MTVSTNLSEDWVSPKEDGTALTALWKFQTVQLSYIFPKLKYKRLIACLMSQSWKHSWSLCLRVHAINMTLPASSCREGDDGEDDNRICMLWHLHFVINILPLFCSCLLFPQIRLTKAGGYSEWDTKEQVSMSAFPPGYLLKMDSLHVMWWLSPSQQQLPTWAVIHWQRTAIMLHHHNIPHTNWRQQKAEILQEDFIPSTGSYSDVCITLLCVLEGSFCAVVL